MIMIIVFLLLLMSIISIIMCCYYYNYYAHLFLDYALVVTIWRHLRHLCPMAEKAHTLWFRDELRLRSLLNALFSFQFFLLFLWGGGGITGWLYELRPVADPGGSPVFARVPGERTTMLLGGGRSYQLNHSN